MDLQVYELTNDAGDKFYVSARSGETTREAPGGDVVVQINQLYANKLGLSDGEVVIIRAVPSIPTCHRVSVEPVSVDDWEILERHAGGLETGLLHQVRVVWAGQVLPVWVERSTCIFISIGSTEPEADCVMLGDDTEVIVAPKVRQKGSSPQPVEQPIQRTVSSPVDAPFINNSAFAGEPSSSAPFLPMPNDYSKMANIEEEPKKSRRPIKDKGSFDSSSISHHWSQLMSMFKWARNLPSSSDEDEGDSVDQSESLLPVGLNAILRVQSLKYSLDLDRELSELSGWDSGSPGRSRSQEFTNRKGSRTSPGRKWSQVPQTRKESLFQEENILEQPSTVYVNMSDLEAQLKIGRSEIPKVFLAKLRRLPSPREQVHAAAQSQKRVQKGKSERSQEKESPESPGESPRSPEEFPPESVGTSSIVRVVVIDRRRQLCDDDYAAVIGRLLQEQPLVNGHVIVPDLLRRQMKLDVTSRVWLQTIKGASCKPAAFSIYPLGSVPKKVSSDMMVSAFRRWLATVSRDDFPLLVFQGLFLRFPVFPGSYIEAQLTYSHSEAAHSPGSSHCCYTVLHPGVLRATTLGVVSGGRVSELTHPAIQPMLAYTSVASFDPQVPNKVMKQLGGVEDIVESALSLIEICLGTRRLYQRVFLNTPGLMNGVLMLTGAKGSGKSSIGRALCRKVAELPNLAHTVVLDCKPLRGKKVDTLQKIFEMMFDEAAWRQPALILLDDLDHLAGAPAGPEFEMSGEALYAARVAEVVKDLLRKDIRNMSRVAVIATSQSRSSLHPILVSSRGTHLVQEVVHIATPDKKQRRAILSTVMRERFPLSESTYDNLNWDQLVRRTEGFVARDISNIVSRAVHAHVLMMGIGATIDSELELTEEDFEVALTGFTPASIRNVPLHQAGDLGWKDVGGLTDVKKTLVETLQWPTKYPQLFGSCPLRLRSGLLLYGAPGTGKTLLAGVVAKECGLNFISIKGPELLSKYIGASEQAVRETFNRAQSAKPCILFFDEFDSIAPRRGHDNTGVTDRVVNQLLTQLDGVEGLDGVYVLAATSRPDLIDPALLRPGRLDKCINCPLPNQEERLRILTALSRKMSIAEDADFEYIAEQCTDYTGADFKALLYNAQLEAIHEVTSGDDSRRGSGSGRFGMKSRADPTGRLKSKTKNHKLSSKVLTRELKSWTRGTYAYIPNLEEGVKEVTAEMEEKLNTQVTHIRLRERRNSEHVPLDELDSPVASTKLLPVRNCHLLAALGKTRPSVSGEERDKYQRIYESFVSGRKGNFNVGYMEPGALKATLA